MEVDDGRLAQELGRPVLVVQLRVQREDVLERQRGLLSPVLEIRLPGKKTEKRGEARLRMEINFSRGNRARFITVETCIFIRL